MMQKLKDEFINQIKEIEKQSKLINVIQTNFQQEDDLVGIVIEKQELISMK
jgi:hypothetical protein